MVMDAYDRVGSRFRVGPDGIENPLLHLRIGTLNCVQFNGIFKDPGINRRNCSASHSDPVIISSQQNYNITFDRDGLFRIFLFTVADSPRQHDNLVETKDLSMLLVFESEQASTDQGLSEFITKIAGPVGSLDQNFLRGLVEPGPFRY